MAKSNLVWDGISEEDFRSENLIDDQEIGDFNKNGMVVFQANINYARQLARAEDSLKPVERRILYTCYLLGALPGHNVKSAKIQGSLLSIHNHNEQAAYTSMINMAQYWKKNVPMITGNCNLGVITAPDEYAASRYTELMLTKYAYECFFEDYDAKAITTNGFLVGAEEPDTLPSKFPNILVNGNSGIGNGFATFMPPFNLYDIVDVCTKVIKDPNVDINELVIAPDFPTECDIVENESEIDQYCKTGKGNITMRGHIDIEDHGNTWVLVIRSIPYGVPFPSVKKKIMALGKNNVVAIKAVHEESKTYIAMDGSTRKYLYFDVEIPKSLDPVKVRSILYKNCDLEKTTPMQMTVVIDEGKTTIKTLNLKQLIQYWIDARRMYKRSLYNHKINKTMSDIEINKAMIFMLDGSNLEKTVSIIRGSHSDMVITNLLKEYGKTAKLNSYQAKIIANKPLSAFTTDAAKRYKEELKRLETLLESLTSVAYSSEKIDKIIISELQELKKYGSQQRKSAIITVENEREYSDTNHRLVFTKNGHVKKLPAEVDSYHTKSPYGALEQGDCVTMVLSVNNLDTVILFNDRGRYSIIPVKDINNNVYNELGDTVFNLTKLDGRIVSGYGLSGKDYKVKKRKNTKAGHESMIITVSAKGFIKKTSIMEFISLDSKKNIAPIKNSVAAVVKPGDYICDVYLIPADCLNPKTDALDTELLLYSKRGNYAIISGYDQIIEFGKTASGTEFLKPGDDDACAGMCIIYPGIEKYAVIVTKNGCMKKIELEYMAKTKKRKDSSYLATIHEGDEIVAIRGCTDKDTFIISTKSGERKFSADEIPTLPRKSVPKKLISLTSSDEVYSCDLLTKE